MSEVLSKRPRWLRVSHPVGAVKTVEELRREHEANHELWAVLPSGSYGPVTLREVDEDTINRGVEFYDDRDELCAEDRDTYMVRFLLDERQGSGPQRRTRTSASFNMDGWIATKAFFFRREEYALRYIGWMKGIGAF